jgi:hypothetical protein
VTRDGVRELLEYAIMRSFQSGGYDDAQCACHLARGLHAGIEIDEVLERIEHGEIGGRST